MRLLKLLIVAAAAVIGPLASIPAHAQLKVEVEGVNFVPVRIAVPEFDATGNGAADGARQIGEGVRADRSGSAVFEIVDADHLIEWRMHDEHWTSQSGNGLLDVNPLNRL